MPDKIYIMFTDIPSTSESKKINRWHFNFVTTILSFIPKANPEYDELIDDVSEWQLEIDQTTKLPVREVGKNSDGNTILIMPWRNNYGYWSDNNITLDYFKDHFKATTINKSEFEKNWNTFAKDNPDIQN